MGVIKMAKLYKITKNRDLEKAEILIENIEIIDSLLGRAKGLLGRKSLPIEQVLWFKPGNNLHTFFMKFTIDCIFVNNSLRVEKVFSRVKPFRLIGPVWKATSFFECSENFIEKWNIQPGDQLHVVD
jgi:uncharacterized membrane protein (UPF0127 family)